MNAAPILVLQMQRMGDLVLTFPLLSWLQKAYPGHPVWVVGEEIFFQPLLPLSPPATYFSYDAAPRLKNLHYHLVINVSHRHEAAALAGEVKCNALFGPYLTAEGKLHIKGAWQLYRASLTNNNRYNRYHWADLNALDCVPASYFRTTLWPAPRQDIASKEARLGLFLGASEAEKHPEAPFWAELAKRFIQLGHRPVLLGGDKEKPLGAAVAGMLGAPALNLTGHFSVGSLAEFIARLDLLITPDTGPMHLAAWTGTPVINLSMGPVSAWETGPSSPGHHVLLSGIACQGCWRCKQERVFCREDFSPGHVTALATKVLQGDRDGEGLARAAGNLELFHTGRDEYGLYKLYPLFQRPVENPAFPAPHLVRERLGAFWQAWFGGIFGLRREDEAAETWQGVTRTAPGLGPRFRQELAIITRNLSKSARNSADFDDGSFWAAFPAMLRPLTGYIQMYVQNESASRQSVLHALSLVEGLSALTE